MPQTDSTSLITRLARPLAVVAAAALLVATVSSAASAGTTVSLKPVADTWVNTVSTSANYGSSTSLRVDGSPVWQAYVRFDLTAVTGTISRSELRIYPVSSSKAGFSVHSVASTTWVEKTTTAANAPAIGSKAISSGSLSAGKTVGIDVTSLVSGHGLVSLALTDNNGTAINLASRESRQSPVLVVTTTAATPVPSALPTSTAAATPAPTATPTPTSARTATATPSPASTQTPSPTPTATAAPAAAPTPPTSAFPVRAAFYYPWFPQAWKQSGMNPFTHYHPSLGFYDGADPAVVASQIEAMQYGKISVGIASWWGQGSSTDVKIPVLMAAAAGTGFKWAFYYEPEGSSDPTVAQIQADLAYINSHYGANPSAYRIGGRPVIFVYAQPADACGMASRWAQANASGADFIVLKVFPGYAGCSSQPNDWHQYSPAVAEDRQAGHSFTISPGFWIANGSVRLDRDLNRWRQEVVDMVASRQPWQLVTTFNEWGEGTSVESATEWATQSGYGAYLDVLHDN